MSLCLARPPGSKRRGRRRLSGPVALWASAVLPAGCVPSRCRNRLVRRWSRDDAHGAGVLTKTTREQSLPSHRLWGCGLLDWTVCHAPCKPSLRPCRPVRRARKIIKQKKGRIACDLGQAPTPLRAGVSVSAWNLTRRESALGRHRKGTARGRRSEWSVDAETIPAEKPPTSLIHLVPVGEMERSSAALTPCHFVSEIRYDISSKKILGTISQAVVVFPAPRSRAGAPVQRSNHLVERRASVRDSESDNGSRRRKHRDAGRGRAARAPAARRGNSNPDKAGPRAGGADL